MARPAFHLLHHGAALAILATVYAACVSGTNTGSGGGGAAAGGGATGGAANAGGASGGGTPAPVVNRWWVTCPLFGCPDVPAMSLPCTSDQQQGQPCNYPGAVCDARLPCGAVVLCTGNDPKGNGCP
jgi:hypothetical protein